MGTLGRCPIESLEGRRMLADASGATVTGIVFRDVNRNGMRDAGELAQVGVKVYLDYNANVTRDGDAEPIATTNAEGRYTFANVTPHSELPIRLLLTGTNVVQTLPANGNARFVTVTAGTTATAEPFGVAESTVVTPPPVTPPVAPTTLGGIVFTDLNRDGARTSTEPGRAGVKVFLDTNNDGTREDGEPLTATDSAGRYAFRNLTAGLVHVRLSLTGTNLAQTKPANSAGYDVTVVANKENRVELFGVAEVPTTATVTGSVFIDRNANATRDAGETGAAKVRVYLDLNNNGTRDDGEPTQLTTGTTGRYVFERVAVTTLTVRLDLTGTRFAQTFPTGNAGHALTTVAGVRYTDLSFGIHETPPVVTPPKGTLRGRVFNDADADGVFDSVEKGLAGRFVYLDTNNNGKRDDGERQALTNSEGRYTFDNLVAGAYDVRVIAGDFTQTQPADDASRHITLKAGAIVGDLNFGLHG